MQKAKQTMEKMFTEGRTVPDVLRVLRNTPIGGSLPTPAELLQGRRLRTQLSVDTDSLRTQQVNTDEIRQLLQQRQAQQAYHSRAGRAIPSTLLPVENVLVQKGKKWIPARVINHHTQPQSYLVETQGGRVLRRTRSQLNKTQESWEEGQLTPSPSTQPPSHMAVNSDHPLQACQPGPAVKHNTNDTPHIRSTDQPPEEPLPVTKRSGRVIQPPSHLQDYVL